MENNSSSTTSILTSLLGVALAAAITFGVWQYRKSGSLFADKSTTEIIADSLNTVNSNLQRGVIRLENELEEQNELHEALQIKYEETNRLLEQKERMSRKYRGDLTAFKALDKEKADRLTILNQEIVELRTLKNSMEEQLQIIPELNTKLQASDLEVKQRYAELEELSTKYAALDSKYKDVVYYAPADNFKVEALKWNDQVTAKAKKSRAIRISFKLPAYLNKTNAETKPVYLTISNDNAEPINGVIKHVNVVGPKADISLDVHATQDVDFSINEQDIIFTVNLDDKKLDPGNYTAKVYTSDDYLGSVVFQLRDSFLFF